MDDELLLRVKQYKAPTDASKKDTIPACKYCGWAEHMQIHKNLKANDIGGGVPYHQFDT